MAATRRGPVDSHAELVIHICSCPHAGQRIRAATLGSLRKTFGSVSISVETESPVVGHLIMTELMASPPNNESPLRNTRNSKIVSKVRPHHRAKKSAEVERSQEPMSDRRVIAAYVSVGRLPPYPPNSRLAKRPRTSVRGLFSCLHNYLVSDRQAIHAFRNTGFRISIAAHDRFELGLFHRIYFQEPDQCPPPCG